MPKPCIVIASAFMCKYVHALKLHNPAHLYAGFLYFTSEFGSLIGHGMEAKDWVHPHILQAFNIMNGGAMVQLARVILRANIYA